MSQGVSLSIRMINILMESGIEHIVNLDDMAEHMDRHLAEQLQSGKARESTTSKVHFNMYACAGQQHLLDTKLTNKLNVYSAR